MNNIDTKKIANLSKLNLKEQEEKELKLDLIKIISFFDKLKELKTEGIDPLYQVFTHKTFLREDKVKTDLKTADLILKNSPHPIKDRYFVLPKIKKI
jgi:aspartyl-tRNA(Asn)/glutamyl-tRNA(Gln) amidotransferase subunit C